MVSRSNLSGRPPASGVLDRVMNPQPTKPRKPTFKERVTTGGGGLSGMVGRAFTEAKKLQAEQGQQPAPPGREGGPLPGSRRRPPKKRSALQTPVAGQKRGPQRQPTAREQAMQTTQTVADMRSQAARHRAGLDQMGATQEEMATPAVMPGRQEVSRFGEVARRGAGVTQGGPIAAAREAAERASAAAATGETGGTRSEVDVTEPTLNQARRRRSRSGRMYDRR